jgi:TBC1 domain family protein 5
VASLKKRDNTLAGLLSEAIHDLSVIKESTIDLSLEATEALDRAFERIQNVQTELQGSSGSTRTKSTSTPTNDEKVVSSDKPEILEREEEKAEVIQQKPTETAPASEKGKPDTKAGISNADTDFEIVATSASPSAPDLLQSRKTPTILPRRPLAQSEFSWMLGDNTHRSSFVSSASLPPDQSRRSESRSRQGSLFGDGQDEKREQSQRDEDSLSLNSFT